MTATANLVNQFNVKANIGFNKKYIEFEPRLQNLFYEYNNGFVESTAFPFWLFLDTFEEFKGETKYQTFPEGYTFRVYNKAWSTGTQIKLEDFERASNVNGNALSRFNIYLDRIANYAIKAKDHPRELMFQMIVNGTTNTYGTCFDQQVFFSGTHSYGITAGTENNIVTGTGTSLTQLETDIVSVMSRFASFQYTQSPNGVVRGLNDDSDMKLLIVAPSQLFGQFHQLKTKSFFNNADNTVRDKFEFVTIPGFTDTNDWYAFITDGDQIMKPFLHQIEKVAELTTPTMNDESVKENKILKWSAYKRDNVAYGAWWRAIKVTNV